MALSMTTLSEQLAHAQERLCQAVDRERLAAQHGDMDEVCRLGDVILMCVNEIRTISMQLEVKHE